MAREDPRVARSKAKILASTLEQLEERGYDGLSIEGIAASAGVGKTTIYRHWATKAALVVDAIGSLGFMEDIEPTGDLRADLLAHLTMLVGVLSDERFSGLFPTMIDAARRHEDLRAVHRAMTAERRGRVVAIFEAAIARGELPADLDVELAIDVVAAPLFYRRIMFDTEVDEAYAARVVDALLPQVSALVVQRP